MSETPREEIYRTIQTHVGDEGMTAAPEGSVLTGFFVVCEWESPNGERWISKLSGDAFRSLPPWRERGLAAEVLYSWWGADAEPGEP